MTQPQPGWYPDPADAERQRYWAGDAWTAETRTSTVPAAAPSTTPGDPYARYARNATSSVPVYKGPASPATAAKSGAGPTTADGVPLAGWWWRVLAFVIDFIALSVVQAVYQPLIPHLNAGLTAWVEDALNAISQGSTTLPSMWDPSYQLTSAIAISTGLEIVLLCLYFGLMTGLVGATLGQMACGLRVVPSDKPRAGRGLPAGPTIIRVLLQVILPTLLLSAGGFLAMDQASASYYALGTTLVPVGVGYAVVNFLWGAWTPTRQCVHDRAARTQVVRPTG